MLVQKVTIIVPVKDEEVGLKFLVEDFQSSGIADLYEVEFIFVIDERTSDNSREIARIFSNEIIDQKDTHGKGAAIKQALEHWMKKPISTVVMLDADGSYSFKGVIDVLKALDGNQEVVSGSRFLENRQLDGMSNIHIFGNRFLSRVSSIRNGRKITDVCTGLWCFEPAALKKIKITSNGFDLEAQLSGQVRKSGLSHLEVPIEWSQRKGGVSKLRSIRDGFLILFRILIT